MKFVLDATFSPKLAEALRALSEDDAEFEYAPALFGAAADDSTIFQGREGPLRRHDEEQQRDPEEVVRDLGWRLRVVVLWRQRDDDPERWVYLGRMEPHEFSLGDGELRWGGGTYRIRLFGTWDRARRRERYITEVAFWIWRRFPATPALRAPLEA